MAKKPVPKKNGANQKQRKATLFQRTRTNFLTGLVVVGPVALTLWVVFTAISFIDARVVPLVPAIYNPSTYLGVDIAGYGVVIFFLFTAAVGALTKGLFGRQLLKIGEGILSRMPIISAIYSGVKQIIETLLSKSGNNFQNACLVQYPRPGIWAIAFISTPTSGEVPEKLGNGEMYSVFLPTTPNPTSGFLLFVPMEDVIVLDMTVEDAAKLVISAGLVVPPTAAEIAAGRRPAPEAQ